MKQMNGYTFSLILILIFLILVAALVWLSVIGSVPAMIVLAVILTITMILIGVAIGHVTDVREHRQAIESNRSMREELDIALRQQMLQNRQNSQLWTQAARQARLPEPKDSGDIIDIDATLFAGFDEAQ